MKIRSYILAFFLCIIVSSKAQDNYKSYSIEELDSITYHKINDFFSGNYPKFTNDFKLHYCNIFEIGDSIPDINKSFQQRKYLFIVTFTDSTIGIYGYLINISFDKDFNLIGINFPYYSDCRKLEIITGSQMINLVTLNNQHFKESKDILQAQIIFDKDSDCFFWEIRLPKGLNNFECLKFDAIDGRYLESYGIMIDSL